jgi:hypothetical protein
MSKTTADRIREKAARLQQRQTETAEDRPARPAPTAAAVHTKPVRSTVDLPPVQHAALKSWCGETAVEIGRSRVTTQDVLRALVARLLTDETLARKIRHDIRCHES